VIPLFTIYQCAQVDTVDVLSAMTGVTVPKATYNTALWSSGILSLLLATALLVWFVCWAKPLVQAVKYMFNPYAMVSASKEVCILCIPMHAEYCTLLLLLMFHNIASSQCNGRLCYVCILICHNAAVC
jgi:hypothetical protein